MALQFVDWLPVTWQRYGIGVLLLILALGARTLTGPLLHTDPSVPYFYAAVALTAWWAGLGPSVLVLGVACVVLNVSLLRVPGLSPLVPLVRSLLFLGAAGVLIGVNAQLRHRLREATDVIDTMVEEKSNFLMMVSHELRTPMTTIMGCAELMAEGCPVPLPPEHLESVALIEKSTVELRRLVDEILSYQQVHGGLARPTYSQVPTTFLLSNVLRRTLPLARKQHVRVILDATDAPPELITDPEKVEVILAELVSNAIKHSNGPTVTLSVQHAEATTITFTVHDTGRGLSRAQQHQVFEPFFQVRDTMTREIGGLGLGLSLARAYAELLDGHLTVESKPTMGARFLLELPCRDAA